MENYEIMTPDAYGDTSYDVKYSDVYRDILTMISCLLMPMETQAMTSSILMCTEIYGKL